LLNVTKALQNAYNMVYFSDQHSILVKHVVIKVIPYTYWESMLTYLTWHKSRKGCGARVSH